MQLFRFDHRQQCTTKKMNQHSNYNWRNTGSKASIFGAIFRCAGYLLVSICSLSVSAHQKTWTSRDDPTWYYTATLSNPTLDKVASTQEGLPFNDGAVAASTGHCTIGDSGLFDGNLFSWCRFKSGHSKVTFLNTKPYAHWFYLEQPLPYDPFWAGTRLLVWGNALHFGPDFDPLDLPVTSWQEGDRLTSYRVWTSATAWSGSPATDASGHIIYLSLAAIEADMFGKKFRSQNTIRQRFQMTDPVKVNDTCCDNGVYEHTLTYDVTLQRYPILVTLPSHIDMGEVPVGTDSEAQIIPVTISANNAPVEITQGLANISFEQVKSLTSDMKNAQCDAALLVSNDKGQVNSGEVVDLHSFYNGIAVKVVNTSGCQPGAHSGALSFTVSWK